MSYGHIFVNISSDLQVFFVVISVFVFLKKKKKKMTPWNNMMLENSHISVIFTVIES